MATNHVFSGVRRGPLSAELRGTDGHELAIVENRAVLVLVAERVPLSRHDQNNDPTQWVSLLSQALVDGEQRLPASETVESRHPPVSARLPWFHVITICGLAVLLFPAGQGRQQHDQPAPEPTVTVTPSVLGWRQERPIDVLSFGDGSALTYRGLKAPEPGRSNAALELSKIGRSALVPLRIALGQQLVMAPGIHRIVLHNLPASAHVSAGVRAADGTWIIESGDFRDVLIAVIVPPNERLAIRIEARSAERLVWVQTVTGSTEPDLARPPAPVASGLQAKMPKMSAPVEAAREASLATGSAIPPAAAVPAASSNVGSRVNVTSEVVTQSLPRQPLESRPRPSRERAAVQPPKKLPSDGKNVSTWRDGVFDKN